MTELDTLLVRLLGDGTSYQRTMRDAEESLNRVGQFQTEATQTTNRFQGASERLAAAHRMASEAAATSGMSYRDALRESMSHIRATETATVSLAARIQDLGLGLSLVGNQARQAGQALSSMSYRPLMQAVSSAAKFEQTTVAFETMLGSAKDAADLLADLTNFAAKTPFEMPEVESAARGLVLFGDRGDDLMNTLKMLGNAASGTSSSFGEIALIFNQIRGANKLMTQDFRQLSTRGVLSLKDIEKHYKISTEAANKMLSEGKISFEDLKKILAGLSAEGGRFANMMEKQSQTMSGQWSTLKDNVNIAYRKIGEAIGPIIKSMIGPLNTLVAKFTELPESMRFAIGGTLALAAAVGGLLSGFGSLILVTAGVIAVWPSLVTAYTTLRAAVIALTVAQNLLNLAVGVGWVGAIALAVVGAVLIAQALYNVNTAVVELNAALKEGKKLDAELKALNDERFKKLLKPMEGMMGTEKKLYLNTNIKDIEKQMVGLNRTVSEGKKIVDSLEPAWYSAYQGGRAVWLAEKENLEANIALRDDQAKRLKELKALLEAMPKNSEATAEATEDAEKYIEKLKEQIATFGMTSAQAEIYKMKLEKVNAGLIKSAQDLNHELVVLEQRKRSDNHTQEILKDISLIGKSAREAELMALDTLKLTKEQDKIAKGLINSKHDHIKNDDLKKEAEELSKSLRTPLEVYKDAVKHLQELQNNGLSNDNFNKAMKQAKKTYNEASGALKTYNNELTEMLHSSRDSSMAGVFKDIQKAQIGTKKLRAGQPVVSANLPNLNLNNNMTLTPNDIDKQLLASTNKLVALTEKRKDFEFNIIQTV